MSRHSRLHSALIAVVGVGIFVGAAQAAPPAGAPPELKIAVVAFLSGPASGPFGIPSRNAADVWIEKINREGGIGGVKVVPVFTDEAGPADKVVTEFRRLAPSYPNTIVINRDTREFHDRAGLLAEPVGTAVGP
jgi:branched-chain amino acid transport system substrate-binding protein